MWLLCLKYFNSLRSILRILHSAQKTNGWLWHLWLIITKARSPHCCLLIRSCCHTKHPAVPGVTPCLQVWSVALCTLKPSCQPPPSLLESLLLLLQELLNSWNCFSNLAHFFVSLFPCYPHLTEILEVRAACPFHHTDSVLLPGTNPTAALWWHSFSFATPVKEPGVNHQA